MLSQEAKLADVESIRLTRDKLEELLSFPDSFFEAIVTGAFAKVVSPKNQYCMCQIVRAVKSTTSYQIDASGGNVSKGHLKQMAIKRESSATEDKIIKKRHFTTNKELICVYGKVERKLRLDRFSNRPIIELEFTQWKSARSKAGMLPLTKNEVQTKFQEMKTLLNKNLSHEEIAEHVDRRVEEKVLKGETSGIDLPY